LHFIYLHGFGSSAASFKAQLVKQFVEQHPQHSLFLVDLPFSPQAAMSLIEAHIETLQSENWAVIGSSLGGFYSTYLAEKYRKKGVLINPAVKAYELLAARLGNNENYHTGQVFEFTEQHLQQLKGMYLPQLAHPENLLLLTQTGDEVLDYRQGVDYYQRSEQMVIEGGNHGFDDYEDYLAATFNFLIGQIDD